MNKKLKPVFRQGGAMGLSGKGCKRNQTQRTPRESHAKSAKGIAREERALSFQVTLRSVLCLRILVAALRWLRLLTLPVWVKSITGVGCGSYTWFLEGSFLEHFERFSAEV